MSEHFNIVGWLGTRPKSNHRRGLLKFAFREFQNVLGHPIEILLIDTRAGIEDQEPWDADSTFLDRVLTSDQLLFVYGEMEGAEIGDRASVCFEESSNRGTIAISLPKQYIDAHTVRLDDVCRKLCSELSTHFSRSLVVGGWEAELPANASDVRDIVEAVRTQLPAVELLAIPTGQDREVPGFQREEVKNGISVFRRAVTTTGH